MSLPHPSTTAQPSTEEANGVMKELFATVANLIQQDLDFHPEASTSRLQLANRIATVISTAFIRYGTAATAIPPYLMSAAAEIHRAQMGNKCLTRLPDWTNVSDDDTSYKGHQWYQKACNYRLHEATTAAGPSTLPTSSTDPTQRMGNGTSHRSTSDVNLGKKRARQSPTPPPAATQTKHKSSHGPEPKANSLPKPLVRPELERISVPTPKPRLTKQRKQMWVEGCDNEPDAPNAMLEQTQSGPAAVQPEVPPAVDTEMAPTADTGVRNVGSDDMGVDIANPGAEECLDGRGRAENMSKPRENKKLKSWVTPTSSLIVPRCKRCEIQQFPCVEWVNKQGTSADSCQQCHKAKFKCHRNDKLADLPRVDGSSRDKTRVGDGMSEVAQEKEKAMIQEKEKGMIQEKEKEHENRKPKKKKRNKKAIVKDQGSDVIENVNRSNAVGVLAAVHRVEEGANEDVVELPLTDTHVAESEAPVLAAATDFPPDHFSHDVDDDDRQAMTTLQDPIQEVQQSVQIVQPPAAPSAHDIRQYMEALRRQMEELSANDIRVRREVQEMKPQVSVMASEVRSLLSGLTSMTSQITTMWNAVRILQDAVLQPTNSSFQPPTIDPALMSAHPTLTVEGRDRFDSPGPTAPIPGYTDTETAPGPSVRGSILQGFRGRGAQGEPRTAGSSTRSPTSAGVAAISPPRTYGPRTRSFSHRKGTAEEGG